MFSKRTQIIPAPKDGAAAANDLFLIAENAQKQQAEEQSRDYGERIIGKYLPEIKKAVDFISADTLEETLLQTANGGNTSYTLFSISAHSFQDYSELSDTSKIIKTRLDQIKGFLANAEKNNRKLHWVDSTNFARNPFNGDVTRTGSLALVLTFTPPQQITPNAKVEEGTATNSLFLIAKNAQKQQAEEQSRIHRELVIGKYQTEIKQAVNFIFADTLEETLLQTAHEGKKSYPLFSISAHSFEDYSDLSDKSKIIKTHLDQIKGFLANAEKNNRKLQWVDSTNFSRNPYNGDVTRTGSLALVLTFTPRQEITPDPKNDKQGKKSKCTFL